MIANESAGLCRGSHPLLNNGERTVSGCIVDDDELDPGMGLIGNALQSCGDRSDFSPHWDDHAHQRICSHQGTIVVGSATHSENVFVDISVPVASALHTLRAITGHRWTSMTANDEGWIPCPICLRTRRAALSRHLPKPRSSTPRSSTAHLLRGAGPGCGSVSLRSLHFSSVSVWESQLRSRRRTMWPASETKLAPRSPISRSS
jgi:hypothetical protein